ncbi:dihydroorotate oxidase electron transfer subunit [Nonomuraea turkmeniaca]|uniref:Dihydroorotate oxidase electron transfer subunit n=1 Tax=Nonomuraea turkmeniaca TaxID=103838 RepID=A0A5S4FJ95_9ACTN|nr:dihydroorotate oxidase electron transfer subunit [Nonomuraea turkmeniaca]TMR20732.1 dihydroorotate oxidase electron transfer subunit [Nonomuraea turkmeniaca]
MGSPISTAGRLLPVEGQPAPAPRAGLALVTSNTHLSDRYWSLRLQAPEIAAGVRPGQFVMVTVARGTDSHPALPRPMAIYDWDAGDGWIEIVYGVVGAGSRLMTGLAAGERITVVGPLGQGFTVNDAESILTVGRGIGSCSLAGVALAAARRGVRVRAVLSGRHPGALVGAEAFVRAGADPLLLVHDADASSAPARIGAQLSRLLDTQPPDRIYTCGSRRLLDLCGDLGRAWGAEVQVSLEAHMACGLGYCHGCSSSLPGSSSEEPLVCADGPVFRWADA